MKHITILATPGINIGSIDNPRRAFLTVNDYLEQRGEPPFFKVVIAGSSKEIPLDNGLCTLHADVEIKDLFKTDLIIIPAFEGDLQKGLEDDIQVMTDMHIKKIDEHLVVKEKEIMTI